MALINKNELEHLAGLARIEISDKEEDILLKDLYKILDYFEEIKSVNTNNIEPLTGGNIFSVNVFREDEIIEADKRELGKIEVDLRGKNEKLKKAFPKEKDGFLKIPPVFE